MQITDMKKILPLQYNLPKEQQDMTHLLDIDTENYKIKDDINFSDIQ